MSIRSITPPEFAASAEAARMSPGILSDGHPFLTETTGSDPQGTLPGGPRDQFQNAFDKIGMVLREAGLSFDSIVEMASYHVGLRDHFDLFDEVRLDYFAPPYPAWTAVEAAGLRREGSTVEIRVIANASEVNGRGAINAAA